VPALRSVSAICRSLHYCVLPMRGLWTEQKPAVSGLGWLGCCRRHRGLRCRRNRRNIDSDPLTHLRHRSHLAQPAESSSKRGERDRPAPHLPGKPRSRHRDTAAARSWTGCAGALRRDYGQAGIWTRPRGEPESAGGFIARATLEPRCAGEHLRERFYLGRAAVVGTHKLGPDALQGPAPNCADLR